MNPSALLDYQAPQKCRSTKKRIQQALEISPFIYVTRGKKLTMSDRVVVMRDSNILSNRYRRRYLQ